MTVVVTGAAGFIGSHLLAALRAEGQTVVCVDRHRPPTAAGLIPLVAELSEPDDAVDRALRRADVVYHLAGCPGVRDRSPDVQWRRRRDNVLATRRVLVATPAATPVIVTSSSSVYGGTEGEPCREDQPLRPLGGYAESKVEAERACAARRDRGGAVVVARLFTVAGERQRPDMAFARWIEAAMTGRPALVLGDLGRTRDITDVRDVAAALIALARVEPAGVVNVGTGTAHTLGDMVAAVGAAFGRPIEADVRPAPAEDPGSTLADPARLARLTGLRPHTDLEALVRRQVTEALRPAGDSASSASTTPRLPVS